MTMLKIPLSRALPVAIAAELVVAAAPAMAWHATGHMVTVQIAYDELSDAARQEVDRLVAVLAEFPPRRDHAVTAALWTDDLKRQDVEAFNSWHYLDRPYAPGFEGDLPQPPSENVVWAIDQAVKTLRGEGGDLAKALMLRFLLHFVGDVHQPLHCASRYSAEYPTGDRGGNDFALSGRYEQLHAFWDAAAGLYPVLDGRDWRAVVRRLSDETTRAVPKDDVPHWRAADPRAWAEESYRFAVEVAYQGISEGATPTPEYTARAHEVVRRRLAVGGYRLGALLNDLFSSARPVAGR